MSVCAIIPARFASTRFPGKMLASLAGQPLILHTWRHASAAECIARVLVATDDERIAAVVSEAGGEAVMTRSEHSSGSDRIAEVVESFEDEYDWILNIQGDEPGLTGPELDHFIKSLNPAFAMATMARRMKSGDDPDDPNLVKVVVGTEGNALYFSRSPIPFVRDGRRTPEMILHHLGIYAFRPQTLRAFVAFPVGHLESLEKLEQLRALENGIRIQVIESSHQATGVDTAEELASLEKMLQESRKDCTTPDSSSRLYGSSS